MRLLHVNKSGAWRNLLIFNEDVGLMVRAAATNLGLAADDKISFRIVDYSNGEVLEYCSGPDFKWTENRSN